MAGPIVASLVLSLTDFGLRDLRNPLGTNFVGLAELHRPAQRREVLRRRSFNTAYFVVVGVPLTLVLGLAAALALDRGIRRFRTLYRVGYYLPVVTSIVAIAVVWRFVLNPDYGLLNMALGAVGIDGPELAGDPMLAMPSLIAMAAWRNLGFAMVVFLAGLQTIPVAAVRGGVHRRRRPLGSVPPRHVAAPPPDAPVRRRSSRRSATCRCSRSRSS